ncbi:MAG: hypothetical protein EU544_00820 [Promethearchaeota archaeon]|nr:MAG: hypothetical protein EU544_00820 [Candidatus Lokiarchaeota archaeon]
MLFVILSSFDNRLGPKIFLKTPEDVENVYLDQVPLLMDLYREGFFIHEFGNLRTANLIFEIRSPLARGRKELLMISIVSYAENFYLDLNSFKEILQFFTNRLKNIKDLYEGFHCEQLNRGREKFSQLYELMHSFYNNLPSERQLHEKLFSQVLTFKLSSQGKSHILENLRQELNTRRINPASANLGL